MDQEKKHPRIEAILVILRKIQDESPLKPMQPGVIIASALRLCHHYGTAEKIKEAGLVGQLRFLLGDTLLGTSKARARHAMTWAYCTVANAEPSEELDRVIAEVVDAYISEWLLEPIG